MDNAFDDRTLTYQVGDKTLTMKPLTFKEFKKALKIVESVSASLVAAGPKDPVSFVQAIPPLLAGKFNELAPLLFPGQGVDEAWVDENLTIPMARKIVMDAARINDVLDFLGHLRENMGIPNPAETAAPKATA